tara:strand:+ start:619 stop:2766 length:2148 start_codon:yes stop_codon:yes gene_type:complete
MYPELKLYWNELDELSYWALDNGIIGHSFEIPLVDMERINSEILDNALQGFFTSLSGAVECKIQQRCEYGRFSDQTSRGKDCTFSPSLNKYLLIHIQKNIKLRKSLYKLLKQEYKINYLKEFEGAYDLSPFKSIGLNPRRPQNVKIQTPNFYANTIKHDFNHINLGDRSVFVLRLVKPTANEIDFNQLNYCLMMLPPPFECSFHIKKIRREVGESFLKRRSKITEGIEGRVGARKYLETEKALEEVSLKGDSLVEIELLINLYTRNIIRTQHDIEEAIYNLRPIGEFKLETVGALNSYNSTLLGQKMHVGLREMLSVATAFCPIGTIGRGALDRKSTKSSLLLHRFDETLDYLDVFNQDYENYSAIIIGKSGSGKSVITNMLTEAILNDQECEIIKVDVGGSHSKETTLLGGKEYKLSLSAPSGINPFSFIKSGLYINDITSILANFISVLILEEGESVLSKDYKSKIEEILLNYIKSSPENPTIIDYYRFAKDHPRRSLLKRWAEGVYANAFKGDAYNNENRLTYYNFEEIFQANDPDFGQGGMAAVMAKFNLDMLFKKDKKLVFIADETPFFVNRCFSFFKFSTANVRKFGASFITISQKLSDLIVNADTGIVDNSNTRILFTEDGDSEFFKKILRISEDDLNKIRSLSRVKGEYSEAVVFDNLGSRTFRIRISPEELYRFSSSKEDNMKIKKLMENVPGLKLKEAIRCLALS